ncbi:MAG: SPOR domain-containing protein, partial [Desulfobacteraceae bacterium]
KGISKRLLLLFVATVILAVGILWHNGLIDPFKASDAQRAVKKDETKPDAKKGVPVKTAIPGRPRKVSPGAKQPASVKESEVKPKTPVPASQPVPKALISSKKSRTKKEISSPIPQKKAKIIIVKKPRGTAYETKTRPKALMGTEIPPVKKEITKPAFEEKQEIIAKKPEPATSHGKSEPDVKSPLPESPAGPKAVREIQIPAHSNEITSYPYSILLYHFRGLERAKNIVSIYGKKGFSAYWVKVELDNGLWYRVFVGHFQNRDKAERFRREHGLKDATVKLTRYANLIGIYPSSHALEDKILALKKLGYSTYVIKEQDGRSRLLVGTFITKEGAEKQRQELESDGIQSQVTER